MTLLPQHVEQLNESAIADDIRRERGYWSATDRLEWARRNSEMAAIQCRLPGLAIPIYRLGRSTPYTTLLRPDHPRLEQRADGKVRTIKYEWSSGLPLCLDILPRYRASLQDITIPIWFTEGAKKADALASLGQNILPISLNGVWCWKRHTADGQSVPLSDFDDLALRGRTAVLAFDSDQMMNLHVQKALDAFAGFLMERSAKIGILQLPHGAKKLGVDDAIAGGWTFESLQSTIEWRSLPSRLLHVSRLGTIPPTTWLIDGVLAMNKLSETFAPPGSGKSFLELDKALCVAQNYPVIYVAAEAIEDYEERVAAWEAHHGVKAGQLYFWPEPIILRDPASVEAFITEIHSIRPAAIVLDPLASCMVGLEESSTGDMTIAVDALNRIRRETGAAVHIVHHTGWSDAHERGSSVLRAACRIVMRLNLDDSGLMTLTCEKANNGQPFDVRYFRLVSAGSSAVPVPANKIALRDAPLSVRQLTILEALEMTHFRDGASFTQIAEHTNLAKSTVNKAISALLDRGYISTEGKRTKSYRLAQKGSDELLLRLADATEGANAPVHQKSELEVNWAVNNQVNNDNNPHQHAEFIEFTTNRAKTATVQQSSEQNTSPLSTSDSASESASSPEFTPSSPSVHPAEFTSSPLAPPLGGEGSELPPSKPIRLRDGTVRQELILTSEYQDVPADWLVPPGAEIILGVGSDCVRKARCSQTPHPEQVDVDWTYVRQMLAIGGEVELKAIHTHCVLKHADYNEVIALAQSNMVNQAQA